MTSAAPRRDGDPPAMRVVVAAPGRSTPKRPDPSGPRRRLTESTQWLRRQRLERQLHDGASLRISALSLRLGLLRNHASGDEAEWQDRIVELQDELHAVLQELREVANKIYPPLLDEAGLGPALRELANERGVEVEVDTDGARFGVVVEGAAYFAIAECLGPRPLVVSVRRERCELVLAVHGPDTASADVMLDQVGPLGGTVHAGADDPADPSMITVRIPCE